MSTEVTAAGGRGNPASSDDRNRAEFDWSALHRRLDASQAALKQKLAPSTDERKKILRARARSLASAGKAEGVPLGQSLLDRSLLGRSLEIVEFVLGAERYGIESGYIREIHPLVEFTPLPCTPAFVLGLVNVRGLILSIINLAKVFSLPERGLTDLNKFIVVHSGNMELGILADAVLGIRHIELDELYPALPTQAGIGADYLKGITKEPLVVLDVEKILSDQKILVNHGIEDRT